MSPETYAHLERLHGQLAVLGLAVLLHPVITLGRRRVVSRGMRLSAWAAAVLMGLPYALGAWLYPTYRASVKPSLIREHLDLARVFETKEHLAFFALVLTLAGAAVLLAGDAAGPTRRLARVFLAAGWACGLFTGLLGVWVAGGAHPGGLCDCERERV